MESSKQTHGGWQEERKRLDEKYKGIGEEQIIIRLLERLDAGTEKLNRLTIVLITLTIVLGILTAVDIFC